MSNQVGWDEFLGGVTAVVGGDLGVGPAVVNAFSNRGAQVVVGSLADAKKSRKGTRQVEGTREILVDICNIGSIGSFFDECETLDEKRGLSRLSTLILVPPPVIAQDALAVTEMEYRETISQELIGPILCIQEASRRMMASGNGGRIISFVSMSGKTGVHRHVAPYAAAKGGLIAFSRVLAAELAHTGITINVIATALFDVQVATMADGAEVVKGIPVGRPGRSEEAAQAALYLSSRNAGYVTGETLNLSGGRFMD